jgi:hypothetical protein
MKKKIYTISSLTALFVVISIFMRYLNLFILDIGAFFFFVVSLVSFVLFVMFLIILIVKDYRNKEPNRFLKLKILIGVFLAMFVFFHFLSVVAGSVISRNCRMNVIKFLKDADINTVRVKIDDKESTSKEEFLNALRKIKKPGSGHFNVKKKIKYEITDSKQSIILLVGQDVFERNTYWIYFPEYRYTKYNRIGGIEIAGIK